MTSTFDIRIDGETYPLSRDVTIQHPPCVHDALGTETEADLQHALDQLHEADWFDAYGCYRGRDTFGIGLVREESR